MIYLLQESRRKARQKNQKDSRHNLNPTLKDRQHEARLRWKDRVNFSLWTQQHFERAGLNMPMPELTKQIIRESNVSQ